MNNSGKRAHHIGRTDPSFNTVYIFAILLYIKRLFAIYSCTRASRAFYFDFCISPEINHIWWGGWRKRDINYARAHKNILVDIRVYAHPYTRNTFTRWRNYSWGSCRPVRIFVKIADNKTGRREIIIRRGARARLFRLTYGPVVYYTYERACENSISLFPRRVVEKLII